MSAANGDFAICTQPRMIAASAMIWGSSHQPPRSSSLKRVTPKAMLISASPTVSIGWEATSDPACSAFCSRNSGNGTVIL